MRDPHEPTVADIRRVFRLLNECLELWADPDAWQAHLLGGASKLVGDSPAGQLQLFQPTDRPNRPQLIPLASTWPSDDARALYLESCDPDSGVELPNFASAVEPAMAGGAVGFTRRMVVPDEPWYASDFYQRYVEPAGADEFVLGVTPAPQLRGLLNVSVMRSTGAPPAEHRAAATLAGSSCKYSGKYRTGAGICRCISWTERAVGWLSDTILSGSPSF